MDITITNGRVLTADGRLTDAALRIEDGRIRDIGPASGGGRVLDAAGGLVLPGIVDLHGDAFERQLQPRPEVSIPVDMALLDTDRQMIASGITTAYHGITYSWEPGLRGRDKVIALLDAVERLRGRFHCDTRVHLRWETYNLDVEHEIAGWLAGGRIDLLAFNDHMDHIRRKLDRPENLTTYVRRTGLAPDVFRDLVLGLTARAGEVPAAVERLAEAARAHDVIMASHDDESPEMRRRFDEIGCRLCEFPVDRETADFSLRRGDPVILGAPNVVRGGSHCGRIATADAVAGGYCSILTSDYYYPSLLQAVFLLISGRRADLATAWRLVSSAPAAAAGLGDRGELAPGRRADVVVVDDGDPALPAVRGVLVAGKTVLWSD